MNETLENPYVLTMKDVCRICEVSRANVNRWRATGKFPEPKRIGGRIRWSAEAIHAWLFVEGFDRS